MDYGNIFISVRQRVAAFRYYNEFIGNDRMYGNVDEAVFLDEAYRFLNKPAHEDFIRFCAKKEGRTFETYCSCLCSEDQNFADFRRNLIPSNALG